MVALTQARGLDFAAASPEAARKAIRETLADEPKAVRRVYAALAHKVWSLLVERRFDAEIRDWHSLLQQVKTNVRSADMVAAERVTALADLLRESISLSETSPASELVRRPNAGRILQMLAKEDGLVPRRKLLEALGMRSANLSNVLTQLLAHNLVERRDKGKEAEFRLTRFGRQLLEAEEKPVAKAAPAAPSLDIDVDKMIKLLNAGDHAGPSQEHWPVRSDDLTSFVFPVFLHGPLLSGDPSQAAFVTPARTSRRMIGGSKARAPVYRHSHILPVVAALPAS